MKADRGSVLKVLIGAECLVSGGGGASTSRTPRLDVCRPDHLGPFLHLDFHLISEFLGRAADRLQADCRQALLDLR
jgi:hypothetical protein